MVQLAPHVWAHRIVCASCGAVVECPIERIAIEWLFSHKTPGVHGAGKPAGVLR